jgi:hypothetical protein
MYFGAAEAKLRSIYPCDLINHHAIKTNGGVKVQLHTFFTSALDGSEWSASSSGPLLPREKHPIPIGVDPSRSGNDD